MPEMPKVVILAGGLGTRLREETEFRPKPMVQIGGHPILWHIMKIFDHHGFHDFVVCLGYKAEIIKEYFYNYEIWNEDFTVRLGADKRIEVHAAGRTPPWSVTLAQTGLQAMTGARISRIRRYVDGQYFLLTYGDGVADIDVCALIRFHKSHGRIATITGVPPPARFGELRVDGLRVIEFEEKVQTHGTALINGGFFVLDQRVFDYLEGDDSCVFEAGPLKRLAEDGELMVYKHTGFWQCLDTLRDVGLLNELWASPSPPWKLWDAPSRDRRE